MIKPGYYRHFKKGNMYKVHFVAKHSETLEDLVIYEALYDNPKGVFWARPAKMFTDLVQMGESKVPRFEFVRSLT
ncbi:MAG TPA: DUF1653 domain-containing protein [Candidatus Woesebacteria bacterium]|nr:DUF1653 domain-containing protein [Candidatus Woesebacteria bacterium]HNS94540.1 DUF1653 domain-containing protein [Candidatus Woesebacteria bacterium]